MDSKNTVKPKPCSRRKTSWWSTSFGCHRCGQRYCGKRYQYQERNQQFPTKRKPQCVHLSSERPQLWSLSEDQNNTSQRSAWPGLYFLQNLATSSRQITKFWTWKTSRDADAKKKRFDRARWSRELDSELSDVNERNIGDTVVFSKIFLFFLRNLERTYTDNAKSISKACQGLQWNHDTSTSSFRNERSGSRVIEVTTVASPHEWWDCAIECYCPLRNVHDKMAEGKTAFENIGWAERQVKDPSVWTENAEKEYSFTASKTKKDTGQYSWSKALQRVRWQRQSSWTVSQSFLVWLERQVTQFQRKLSDCHDCQKKKSRNLDQESSTTKAKKLGSYWRSTH